MAVIRSEFRTMKVCEQRNGSEKVHQRHKKGWETDWEINAEKCGQREKSGSGLMAGKYTINMSPGPSQNPPHNLTFVR